MTGRRWVDLVRGKPSLLPSSESRTLSWTSLRKYEQSNSYLKPTGKQTFLVRRHVARTSSQKHEQAKFHINRRRNKISDWQPVHHQFITGLSSKREAFFLSGFRTEERSRFVSINYVHTRHVRELKTCRAQNPDIPRANVRRITAGRKGRAKTGSTRHRRNCSPRIKSLFYLLDDGRMIS